eukprot:COSAG02_NODE_2552_length_8553_cov_4.740123_3_plen_103_part_00
MKRQLALAALLGSAQAVAPVQLRLGGAIGRTEDNFICVNMDWWPVSIPHSPQGVQCSRATKHDEVPLLAAVCLLPCDRPTSATTRAKMDAHISRPARGQWTA